MSVKFHQTPVSICVLVVKLSELQSRQTAFQLYIIIAISYTFCVVAIVSMHIPLSSILCDYDDESILLVNKLEGQ